MEPARAEQNDQTVVNLLPEQININNNEYDEEESNEKYEEEQPPDETEKLVKEDDHDDISVHAILADDTITEDNGMVRDTSMKKDIPKVEIEEEEFESKENHDENKKKKCCCCACLCCHKKRNRKGTNMSEKMKSTQNRATSSRYQTSRCNRCCYCCKRFLAFLFSRIGLCSLVVAYAIMGGFIFKEIEAPEEQIIRHQVESQRQSKIAKLWNITQLHNIFSKENWTIDAERLLLEFQTEIYMATKEKGWDGKKEKGELQWTFSSSLLYSITVITTIGYGNTAPKTNLGRLITIIYAIFGIPLTLLCLANLGSSMGNCFRFFYKHFCKIVICLCCPQQAQWYAKRRSKNLSNIPELDINNLNKNDNKVKGFNAGKEERVRVPIFVSLLLIGSYILAGAVIFATWEDDWDLLIGSYFCFITLSTIGFGDFVPGSNSGSFDNQEKMIICSVYLIFGLSMIAMCFNLMQEEVRAKFRWLGEKIGIIESN
ncbi:K2P18.1 [Mytilus edulis]|uniref:KCNK18 n=1 Tax=Mytilus edulis TaxID=6550 RepID=A0A8S3RJZ4_MYTED|nr:K2P18.1 [Mytilus edulis]